MRGIFQGPGGKLTMELSSLNVLTILNSTKRNRKEKMKVLSIEKN